MPVWQRVYEEINDPNFVILSAAQDVGGEPVAGPIFDAANPTYIQVVDDNHIISSAFNFVNVPSGAWIDEQGRIVRIDEGTYAKVHEIKKGEHSITFGTNEYVPALKDWVMNGPQSRYVQSAHQVRRNIRQHTPAQVKADAAFRLGNLFRAHGKVDKAEHFWTMARTLNPDSVNFIRQHLTLTEEGSAGPTFMKLRQAYATEGKDYYRPLDLAE